MSSKSLALLTIGLGAICLVVGGIGAFDAADKRYYEFDWVIASAILAGCGSIAYAIATRK